MKLCIFDDARIGVVRAQAVFDVTAILDRLPAARYGVRQGDALIAALPSLRPAMEELAAQSPAIPLANVMMRVPVGHPGKLLGAPLNYQDHVNEAKADPATFAAAQIRRIHELGFFLKAPSSLAGCADGITLSHTDRRTDHEVELAVVMGRRCRRVARHAALDYVAGYSIGLDITLRGPEERSLRKSIDTYSVLGPYLVTADELGDPSSLDLCLEVNGEVRQQANTRELIIDVPGLIEFASAWYTLEPGDVIYSGTPAGVGPLNQGDSVQASIERVGSINLMVQ
jgi:2-keto-4-pentenoate hydratase/2-oxohepta-3-ene-1,7-dioic acid hydratase in catechol pathway